MKEAFEKIKDFLKSKFDYCAEQAGMNLNAECGSEIASYFRERKELYLDRANIYGEVMREIEKVEAEFVTDTNADGKGWIPCSERLPEKENVLCYAVSLARNPDTIFVGAYRNGVWFLQSAIATISYPTQYKVTAWMPLPEPWKGE